MTYVLGKHSPPTQSVLHQFQVILCKSWNVEIHQIDFPIIDSLLNDLTFSSRTKRNLSRHVLLLSSTYSPDREKV